MTEPGDTQDKGTEGGRPNLLAALLIIVGLVMGGYFLVAKLKDLGDTQDCLMQGRTNCAPIAR
jgi:hypothetical protein